MGSREAASSTEAQRPGGPISARVRRVVRRFAPLCVVVAVGACGESPSPAAPSVAANSATGTITGSERIAWTQSASDQREILRLGFAIYVDGARSALDNVQCTGIVDQITQYDCAARLPALTGGSHTLQLASFFPENPSQESERSAPLQVTVAALTSGEGGGPMAPARGPAGQRGDPKGPREVIRRR